MEKKRYLKLFQSQNDYDAVKKDLMGIPHVVYFEATDELLYVDEDEIDYALEFFTIEALEDGLTAKLSTNACEYRIDNGEWIALSAGSDTQSINKGQTLSFRGDLTPTDSNGIGTFTIGKRCNLKGNIMSMLYGDNFEGQNDLSSKSYAFYSMFRGCTNVVKAHRLILPATTLASSSYSNMFYGCTSLTTAPELSATTLASNCYSNMFEGCTSLTEAPQLPATTLAKSCYYFMFSYCTSLTEAPQLPATTLADECYYNMFQGCTSLMEVPQLSATTLAYQCYSQMFYGCTSLTTAPQLPATTLADECYYNMFYGCTSLTTAPQLPATTLAEMCYTSMFDSCTSLTKAPQLPATTLARSCYSSMFNGCSNLNYIKMLATDISATRCLNNWVNGVASIGTFVKNAAMTSLPSGINGIPSGWTVVNEGESVDTTINVEINDSSINFLSNVEITEDSISINGENITIQNDENNNYNIIIE